MRKTIFVDIISILLIILFIYAATSKLLDHQKFQVQLGQSPILTEFAGVIVWMIPLLEILVAFLLAIQRWRVIGLYASFSLMTMFSAYIVAITRFSEYIPCSCGGILDRLSWNDHLLFNFIFTILSVVGILIETSLMKYTPDVNLQKA